MLAQSANTDPVHFKEASLDYTDAAGNFKTLVFDAVLSEDWHPSATVTEHPVEDGANVADHVRVGLMTCTLKIHVTNEPTGDNQFATAQNTVMDLDVTSWSNGLDLAVQVAQIAGLAADVAGTAVDGSPLGNKTAALFRTIQTIGLTTAATGESYTSYDITGALSVGNYPIRSAADAASALTYEGIANLAPGGAQSLSSVLVGPVVQFQGTFVDFASELINLLTYLMEQATLFNVIGSKRTRNNMVITDCPDHRGATEETGTGAQIEITLKEIRIVQTSTVTAPTPALPRAQVQTNAGAQDNKDAPVPAQKKAIDAVIADGGNPLRALFGNVFSQ
jgi:hypothetical protein